MANRKLYTLFGFSSELDWRPTAFVGPIPRSRVCACCGRIPMSGLLLPCEDLVCLPCFESDDSCPVHEAAYTEEELQSRTFPLRYMMQRKVYCWNSSKGCDAVGMLSLMLEHYEKDCPFSSAPAHSEEGTAELGQRHSNPKPPAMLKCEQRTQNVLKEEVGGAVSRNKTSLEDSNLSSVGDFKVESDDTSCVTSHSIALSTRAGSLGERVHSSVTIHVDTRSRRTTTAREAAECGSRNIRATRAHEPMRRAFKREQGRRRSDSAEPPNLNQETDVEHQHRHSRSSSDTVEYESVAFLPPRRAATSSPLSEPRQGEASNDTSESEGMRTTDGIEAVSKRECSLGDARAESSALENCPNETLLSRYLQETQHGEPSGPSSIVKVNCAARSEELLMDHCGSTERQVLGIGPFDTTMTVPFSDDCRVCHEASMENEPPADDSVKAPDHRATDNTREENVFAVPDSSPRSPGNSDDGNNSLKHTEPSSDALSHTVYPEETGYEACCSVRDECSQNATSTAAHSTRQERPEDIESAANETSCGESAQERPGRLEASGTHMPLEEVYAQTKRKANVPSLSPAATQEKHELCESEEERIRTDRAQVFDHTSGGSALKAQLSGELCTSDNTEFAKFQALERTFPECREPGDSQTLCERVKSSELDQGVFNKGQPPEMAASEREERTQYPGYLTSHALSLVTDLPGQYRQAARDAIEEEATANSAVLNSAMPPGQGQEEGLHTKLTQSERGELKTMAVHGDGSDTIPAVGPTNDVACSVMDDMRERQPQEGLTVRSSGTNETRDSLDFSVFEPRRFSPLHMCTDDHHEEKDISSTTNTKYSMPSVMVSEMTSTGAEVDQPEILAANLPLSRSYTVDDRNGSQVWNCADEERRASCQRYAGAALENVSVGRLQSATSSVGAEQACLDFESMSNKVNFPAILSEINEAIEFVSEAGHFPRSNEGLGSPRIDVKLIQGLKTVSADALKGQRSYKDQDNQLTSEYRYRDVASARDSKPTQSNCLKDRSTETTLKFSVTGNEGCTAPSKESTDEEDVEGEDPMPSQASALSVYPNSSVKSATLPPKASLPSSFNPEATMCCIQAESCNTEENSGARIVFRKVEQSSQRSLRRVTSADAAKFAVSSPAEERPMAEKSCSDECVASGLIRERLRQDVTLSNCVEGNDEDSNLCDETSPLGESRSNCDETKTEHLKVLMSLKLALDAALTVTKETVTSNTRSTLVLQELHEQIRRSTFDVVNVCKAMLHNSFGNLESFEWCINKCDEVKNRAMQIEYLSLGNSSLHYFCGYNIRPSVFFRKRAGIIEIHPELTLYKGVYDDFIKWPFEGKCKLAIVHPSDAAEDVVLNMDDSDTKSVTLAFMKPKGIRNIGVYFQKYHSFQDIENRGFISDNKLRLRFEVFSPSEQ